MPPKKTKSCRHLPAFLLLAPGHGRGAALFARMHALLPLSGVDTGAVYRTLNALEAQSEVAGSWDTNVPGPARKIYRLTDAGWERLPSGGRTSPPARACSTRF